MVQFAPLQFFLYIIRVSLKSPLYFFSFFPPIWFKTVFKKQQNKLCYRLQCIYTHKNRKVWNTTSPPAGWSWQSVFHEISCCQQQKHVSSCWEWWWMLDCLDSYSNLLWFGTLRSKAVTIFRFTNQVPVPHCNNCCRIREYRAVQWFKPPTTQS